LSVKNGSKGEKTQGRKAKTRYPPYNACKKDDA